MRSKHPIVCALLVLVGLLWTVPAYAGACYADLYVGKTGGAKIQSAIYDTYCSTIYVNPIGPDWGNWNLETPITVSRSGVTIRSLGDSLLPVLVATGTGWTKTKYPGMITIDGQTDVLLNRLNLQGNKQSYNGVWIRRSVRITVEAVVIARNIYHGVHATSSASTNIEVAWTLFADNGLIDVRTDTSDGTYHSNVLVHDSWMYGTLYGIAFANCGRSDALRCEATDNTIQPKKGSDPNSGSGIDLNRAHNAFVSGNDIYGAAGYYCLAGIECQMAMGITVDDTRNTTIEYNSIEGAVMYGIVLANGAIPRNSGGRPGTTS
jgi:hypothetical protein